MCGAVIELDGSIHDEDERKENDIKRNKALSEMGLKIVRLRNEEVLKDLSQVIGKIQELISI